ncbi:MAG: NADH-quinone oxidoreductase subunit M [Flavobacteriaceae bacterium]|nr:NADH-quinone oxidoreductase subunit M [Flavobacteriaceae bacterium]
MLLFLILLPLVGSVLLFFLKGNASRYFALLIALGEFLGTVLMLSDFNVKSSISEGLQHEIIFNWLSLIKSNLHFGVDGISMLMLFLVNLLIPIIIFSAFNEKKTYPNTFFSLILLMQFGLVGVFTALDGLVFYMFWELCLIPIWFISGLWGQEDMRIKVTKKFFIYTFLGSLLMLVGLVYLYQFSESFALLNLYNTEINSEQQALLFWLIFLAFAVKFPLFPFHTWLPDTHTYAPTQGSMLLSGIMLKMAVYGVLRYLLPIVPEALQGWSGEVVVILAVVGVLYGAFIALITNNIKTIIAYSSVSHLGMMAGGIFASAILSAKGNLTTEGVEGAMLQTMAHGINAVGLFYCADILYKRLKTKDITQMGGVAKVAPKFAVLFLIILLGSMAVPLTNGFVGEFTLLKTLYEYNIYLGISAGLSIILGAGYLLRLYSKTMLGKGDEVILKEAKDLSWVEFFVLGILAILVLIFGIFPNLILDLVREPLVLIYSFLVK